MRWMVGHASYEAHHDRLVGREPIYKYGIIMQVSPVDSSAIVVHSYASGVTPRLVILNGVLDNVEILSKGGNRDG